MISHFISRHLIFTSCHFRREQFVKARNKVEAINNEFSFGYYPNPAWAQIVVVFRAEEKVNLCILLRGFGQETRMPKRMFAEWQHLDKYTCPGKKRLNSSAQLQIRKKRHQSWLLIVADTRHRGHNVLTNSCLASFQRPGVERDNDATAVGFSLHRSYLRLVGRLCVRSDTRAGGMSERDA